MSRDFFEALTEPGSSDQIRPLTAEETALAGELQPALSLLAKAGPTNGINLVPVWEELLAIEMSKAPAAAPSPIEPDRRQAVHAWWQWISYAAVLLIGVGIGALASNNFHSSAGGIVEKEHYSMSQKQLMMAMLDTTVPPSAEMARLASVDLARCIACHETLKQRLQKPGLTSDAYQPLPKLSSWSTRLAQKTLDLVESNGKT